MPEMKPEVTAGLFHITPSYYLKQHDLERQLITAFSGQGYRSLADVERQRVVFDLSHSFWHDLGALLWILNLLNQLRTQQNRLLLLLPDVADSKGANLWSFLLKWNFFDALSKLVDPPVNLLPPEQIPLLSQKSRYTTAYAMDPFTNRPVPAHTNKLLEITDLLDTAPGDGIDKGVARYEGQWKSGLVLDALAKRCGWKRSRSEEFVHYVIGEGARNAVLHGNGTMAIAAMRTDNRNLTFAVADNGMGIPDTLRTAFRDKKDRKQLVEMTDADLIRYYTEPEVVLDSEWITLAVRAGVTSAEDYAGLGLFYLKKLVLEERGELRIRSGSACVDFFGGSKVRADENLLRTRGTLLRVIIPLGKDGS